MSVVRCAIYTRKSSDEGLEQDFNSLDAQREACAAYVRSQASEGWKLLPEAYDDGGISGGTLERPGLQRLLAEVKAGRIDIIVVYKVDRLTRSLLDFSKLVETFDAAGTSFVSVTQSFNTTTSMGRLTLNMLLSFAQFEREVTAERIRDKIAASKAKGMWMGGTPPIGYKPEGRSLAIVEEHASLVRDIYERYRQLGNVRLLAEGLIREGVTTPRRTRGKGPDYGGGPFTRGQIYSILRNPIYVGDIPHKGRVFPGNHPAIIDRAVWDAVQDQLTSNVRGHRLTRERNASLLAGLLVDAQGEPLACAHTNKGSEQGRVRYRYYVSKAAHHGGGSAGAPALRLPAREIEQVVRQELAALFSDIWRLFDLARFEISPPMIAPVTARCADLSAQLGKADGALLKRVLTRVEVRPERLMLTLAPAAIAGLLGLPTDAADETAVTYEASIRLSRTGRAVRLIHDDGTPAAGGTPDASVIRLVLNARRWWRELSAGDLDIPALARRHGVSGSWLTRVLRLAFLSPDVIEAALAGELRAGVDGKSLTATGAVPAGWDEQSMRFLPG